MRTAVSIFALAVVLLLQGCAAAVVAGAATGAAVAHDRRTMGSIVDDEAVEIKAGGAILADNQLKDQAHVNVTSMNGIVLLSGEAASAELRDRVLSQVRPIPSIRRIHNEIRIAPPSSFGNRSLDSWYTTKVKSRLLFTKDLDATRVKVVTENATVYLLGLVTQREAEIAANSTAQVGGIAGVVKLFEYIDGPAAGQTP
ncbi:MAG: BON domain-containing protein [Candidatus Muproteobacteria bacterium RBG_16_64_11]|uniref:BON domain-containing protein n=1 Tax=Candidatus Muproteobacteria bacterium RBG_16_64_11 TaxID=1817758 RepID=A0A1F6TH66_9PROT|nr:MAG: BON domain-containing protein [Candidatus Muproteobacteria bacterium RBG_16_64_11]